MRRRNVVLEILGFKENFNNPQVNVPIQVRQKLRNYPKTPPKTKERSAQSIANFNNRLAILEFLKIKGIQIKKRESVARIKIK